MQIQCVGTWTSYMGGRILFRSGIRKPVTF
jgi:hypothetical protein